MSDLPQTSCACAIQLGAHTQEVSGKSDEDLGGLSMVKKSPSIEFLA